MKTLLLLLLTASACFGQGLIVDPYRYGLNGGVTNAFVTAETLGSPVSNYDGYRGYKFSVSSTIVVTHLARWVVAGNSQTHTVKLEDDLCAELANVSVNTSGAPTGAYLYVVLATPIFLSPGTYAIMSEEFNGGDQHYFNDTFITGHTSDAAITTPLVDDPMLPCTTQFNGPESVFGPLSFKYIQ